MRALVTSAGGSHVSPTLDGMVAIDGLLDAEGGEIVISALESAMQSAGAAGDVRTRPQQRADALVELCRVGARDHAAGPGRRHRPHVTVVLDVETLDNRVGHSAAARARRARRSLARRDDRTDVVRRGRGRG